MAHVTAAPRIKHGAHTDRGRLRPENQDAHVVGRSLFAVADGVGSGPNGKRAAGIAIDALRDLTSLPEVSQTQLGHRLTEAQRAIEQLNRNRARPTERAATTLSGLAVTHAAGMPYWLVLNVGDSRCYRLANGRLLQLTQDHSEVQALLDAGQLTAAEARTYPRRHVISRALGSAGRFKPDYLLEPVTRGERLLVCTDGLTSELNDVQIQTILTAEPDPQQAAGRLVAEALNAGGRDNVTVIVVDVIEVPEPYIDDEATLLVGTGPQAAPPAAERPA